MAQDRLWQADLFRRMASGRLAEFGLASIDDDYEIRKTGYSQQGLRAMYDAWEPIKPDCCLKDMFQAYVDGINQYIAEALEAQANGDLSKIPIEYLPGMVQPEGLPLEPFTIEDSVSIVVMMAWQFGGTGGNELRYAAALEALQDTYEDATALAIFNDLFPQEDPGAEVTIPGEVVPTLRAAASGQTARDLPENIGEIYERYNQTQERLKELFESLGLPIKFGSNAWVVSPENSESGNAMQVGGPQMGQSIPQIVHELGLHGAGINAVGMSMPFGPSIIIGVSQHGAWTSTTGSSDVIDTYIVELDETNTFYLYNNFSRPIEVRTEIICDYEGNCEDREVLLTVHGPVVELDAENHLAYVMKTPFFRNELAAEEGWQLFQQARTLQDFEDAVETIQPSHNFCWIDRLGNIGYWHAGTYPIRPLGIDDRLPFRGTGEEYWLGITGSETMPRSVNPAQGFLANWNNKPVAGWPYAEVDWGQGHRVKQIQDLLAGGGPFTFDDMNGVNRDAGYNHIAGMNFLGYLVEAVQNADADSIPTEVIQALEDWDHHYNDVVEPMWPSPDATYDDPGLTIFDRWYSTIKDAVFGDDLPDGVTASDSTLIHVFHGEDSTLDLQYDFLNGEDRDTVILEVLEAAISELEAEFGSNDVSTWLTPVITITFDAQGALPGPTMHGMNRGTYNHIAEMPYWRFWEPPHAVDVIPPGQSGFTRLWWILPIPSRHADDQLAGYESWSYKPMWFRFWDIWTDRESWITLEYPSEPVPE
jgi:penicillin amidase